MNKEDVVKKIYEIMVDIVNSDYFMDKIGVMFNEEKEEQKENLPEVGELIEAEWYRCEGEMIIGYFEGINSDGNALLINNAESFNKESDKIKKGTWRYPEIKRDYEKKLVPGKPCLVRDNESTIWKCQIFYKFDDNRTYKYGVIILERTLFFKYAIPFDADKLGKVE